MTRDCRAAIRWLERCVCPAGGTKTFVLILPYPGFVPVIAREHGGNSPCAFVHPFPEAVVKIKLTPEALEVQSFVLSPDLWKECGTVNAHQVQSRPISPCYSQHSCVYPCTDEPGGCV